MKFKRIVSDIINNEKMTKSLGWGLSNSFAGLIGCIITVAFTDSSIIFVVFSVSLLFVLILAGIILRIDNDFNLVKILKKDQKNRNWREIIRIAYPLSRPLWLSRKYKLRVALGKFIEDACIHLLAENEKSILVNETNLSIEYIRSSVLIDDLGWTLFRNNKNFVEQSKENINKGIGIAKENKQYAIMFKGYRHLLGILMESEDSTTDEFDFINSEIEMLKSERDYIEINQNEKIMIEAGMKYAHAKRLLTLARKTSEGTQRKEVLKEAEENIDKAIEVYQKEDSDRYAKTFYVKAGILIQLNTIEALNKAKDLLKKGLIYCQSQQERDKYYRIAVMLLETELSRLRLRTHSKEELEMIKSEGKALYNDVMKELTDYEDGKTVKEEFKKTYNLILKKCK